MKGRQTALIILMAVVFSLIIYVLYKSATAPVVWYEYYRENEKQPYDLSVTTELLHHYFPGKNFTDLKSAVNTSLPESVSESACYFFIGHSLYLTYEDRNRLYDFVSAGNEAFIAANEFPDELFETLFNTQPGHFDSDSVYDDYMEIESIAFDSMVHLNFLHPDLKSLSGYEYEYIFQWMKFINQWHYFNDSLNGTTISLGELNDSVVNFIRVPYGRGAFYFHTNPIVFTNYQLKSEQRLEYAEKVFSHLQPANIYWDEFSKVPPMNFNGDFDNETPLRYILSQPSLRWAWYVLLAIAILFMIFRTKRTQRIIPVTEQNVNSSLEYIQTIGKLYLAQNDHRALALQQMKLFLAFIRERYSLQVKELDSDFIKTISVKSQVAEKNIRRIRDDYKTIQNMEDILPEQLIEFHSLLEGFYSKCK